MKINRHKQEKMKEGRKHNKKTENEKYLRMKEKLDDTLILFP
jgi:hypothetical protein